MNPTTFSPQTESYDAIIFCESWNQTYPRHLKLLEHAGAHKILYIETPTISTTQPETARVVVVNDYLHLLRSEVSAVEKLFRLLPATLRNKKIPLGIFCHAGFSPLLELLRFETVINDCVRKPSFHPQENQLLRYAHLTITENQPVRTLLPEIALPLAKNKKMPIAI